MDQVGLDHFPFYVVAGGGRSVGGVVRGGKSPRGTYWAALLPEVALGCCWAVLSVAGRVMGGAGGQRVGRNGLPKAGARRRP
jgi:hypothetical protein